MCEDFEGLAREVCKGTITFDQYARGTEKRWTKLAWYLKARWSLPGWTTLEDIRQDLLLGAWAAIERGWDQEKSKTEGSGRRTPSSYIEWNAIDHAKKRIHKARLGKRLHRGEEKAKSRIDKSLGACARSRFPLLDSETEAIDSFLAEHDIFTDADQQTALEAKETALSVAHSISEVLIVQAIAAALGGYESAIVAIVGNHLDHAKTFAAAARIIYSDPVASHLCRVGSEAKARRMITKSARHMVDRIAA